MKTEENIRRLFAKILAEHGGNKAAAASSLDTNAVTFWGWVTGKRGLNKALCKAIDKAGGRLVVPGDPGPDQQEAGHELILLRERVEHLKEQNGLLRKLVEKYEADELQKNTPPKRGDLDSFPGAGKSL